MTQRANKNVLPLCSTEAQITADVIENGNSLNDARNMVNEYRKNNNLKDFT